MLAMTSEEEFGMYLGLLHSTPLTGLPNALLSAIRTHYVGKMVVMVMCGTASSLRDSSRRLCRLGTARAFPGSDRLVLLGRR